MNEIEIDVVDGVRSYIKDGRIYDAYSAVDAKDEIHSLPIHKQQIRIAEKLWL